MNGDIAFDVFGHRVTVTRINGQFFVRHIDASSIVQELGELAIPPDLGYAELPEFLADALSHWPRLEQERIEAQLLPVFVYGTLRHGYPNSHYNQGCPRGGTYRLQVPLPLQIWPLMTGHGSSQAWREETHQQHQL